MATSGNSAFFRRSSFLWITSVTLLISFFTWTVFWPQHVPYDSLGPLGTVAKYCVDYHYSLMYYGWFLALLIHIAEAFYALKVCREKGISSISARSLWFLQTLLFGFGSLGLLLKHRPDGRSKRR